MRLLPSKRAHLYVLERARIVVRDGRVEYLTEGDDRELRGFNVPVANTSFILIGPGSSITTEAVRRLREEGVCLGFCGTGGTPLLAAQDPYPDLITPADEYRDPRFLHRWIDIWRDDAKRMQVAKSFFGVRLEQIERCWTTLDFGVGMPDPPSDQRVKEWRRSIDRAATVNELLGIEGSMAKSLYAIMAAHFGFKDFERMTRQGQEVSDPNMLLDHGNYLAYGLASVVLWCLGIPPALAVLHGKTRRGAMVFDLADVIKDGLILPMAFAVAHQAHSGEAVDATGFRSRCIIAFDEAKAPDILFKTMIEAIDTC